MKIYQITLSFIASFIGTASVMATPPIVTNPVADYIARHSNDFRPPEETNEHVLKFEIDVDNDGKTDVFLSSEKSALLSKEYENDVRSWDLYKNEGSGNYAVIDQELLTAESDVFLHPSAFLFDPEKLYIGPIIEIGGSRGILAMFYISSKNGAYISAYILRDGYFERKNFPNPAQLESRIYHRDDSGDIPDFPNEYKRYFATPLTQNVTVLSQTF